MLLAHPKSAAHGLNLWSGGNRIVWFSPTWSNELKLQFDGRLHRQGQKNTVYVHTIAASGTVDYDIMNALVNKKSVQDIVIKALS
jgi:SNF2 family DNA or RNA helicase